MSIRIFFSYFIVHGHSLHTSSKTMTSLQLQPSWLSSLNTIYSSTKARHVSFKVSFSLNPSTNTENEPPQPPTSPDSPPPETTLDPVKLAFEKAKAYKKKSIQSAPVSKFEQNPDKESAGISNNGDKTVQASTMASMEKTKEYNNNNKGTVETGTSSGLKEENKGKMLSVEKGVEKKEKLRISNIDFIGLNFADKKTGRGVPAGLVPLSDPFPEGDSPDVEIIVGDTSKFEEATVLKPEPTQQEDKSEFYKPKVSTWGVFPRPENISKTFGGGRTIRPGDVIETAEDRAAKEKHTKQLIAAYKKRVGLSVDPKLKSECEKAMKHGDALMDSGNLKEALPYFEKVMNKMAFKNELYGLAALQWSVCQDSLHRPNEARIMYEKLQSHPNASVRKKASQFLFSFQAMEMMKITSSNLSKKSTGYQNYFEAFIEDYKINYPLQEAGIEEGALSQALPYMIFLVSPVFIVLFIAVQKGNLN
ncbi:hypothetical protein Dsin_010841 [Dipteronia sinensis]|uniref:Uncharacterized protein n=1 Tax=Dipteronia sinensis TaxID=43782 RepID=A0AAE0AT94_9ROSI|nr:hypothetical protein Dsin_010841 [Dipteronia sinensis]